MDYRLQKFLQPWITVRFGYDNFDIISLAGSVHDYEMVLKYVQLAVQIHSINTTCLINHEDCRAYGRGGRINVTDMIYWKPVPNCMPYSPDLTWRPFIFIWMGHLS